MRSGFSILYFSISTDSSDIDKIFVKLLLNINLSRVLLELSTILCVLLFDCREILSIIEMVCFIGSSFFFKLDFETSNSNSHIEP